MEKKFYILCFSEWKLSFRVIFERVSNSTNLPYKRVYSVSLHHGYIRAVKLAYLAFIGVGRVSAFRKSSALHLYAHHCFLIYLLTLTASSSSTSEHSDSPHPVQHLL